MFKEPNVPFYLTSGRIIGFPLSPRVLALYKMQTALPRFWTRVAVSISSDSNYYTMNASVNLVIYNGVYMTRCRMLFLCEFECVYTGRKMCLYSEKNYIDKKKDFASRICTKCTHTHAHTLTHCIIYMYVLVCVCVCVCLPTVTDILHSFTNYVLTNLKFVDKTANATSTF